jgi:molecular chaperone GrpE
MSDDRNADETSAERPADVSEPLEEATAPTVAFVVPAEPYESIATIDALAASSGDPGVVAILAAAEARAVDGPTPAATADLSPVLESVAAMGASLGERLDGLRALFEREVRAEATREKVVDRLHAELQEYKQDLLLNVLRPVFVDLIQLHDDIGKIVDAQDVGPSDGEAGRLLGLMRGFQQGIEDILDRQGVEAYSHDGDAFDPRRQRAVATVPTPDPALARTIAVRHRKGFRSLGTDRVIRPEIVSVYALKRDG